MTVDYLNSSTDLESNENGHGFLMNDTVFSFAWKGVTVNVKDRHTKRGKSILSNAAGYVNQGVNQICLLLSLLPKYVPEKLMGATTGEVMALMGPSGSGKTTLLNALAHRNSSLGTAQVEGDILVNGKKVSLETFRYIGTYVEQEDVLIGSLTVEETLHFAGQLSLSSSISKKERLNRIRSLLNAFGIQNQAKTLVGTPIQKGISGGQKRRVSVASQLITRPKIVFLDEPTSGLDSTASFEVMSFVKNLAVKNNVRILPHPNPTKEKLMPFQLIVIASIHQPSSATFETFDKLLILSAGKTCYFGQGTQMKSYFDGIGYPIPLQTNPAEFVLELVNTDFANNQDSALTRLKAIHDTWDSSPEAPLIHAEIESQVGKSEKYGQIPIPRGGKVNFLITILTLLHRSFIKSYRDVVAYGIRIAMYLGLAIMMGTVWLRLGSNQENIQPFINALFFSSAFMSFMAVAYVPSFLEDRSTFIKERANGLYGATSFIISNFIIGIPFLCPTNDHLVLITLLFSVVAYWLVNFRTGAEAFFMFVMWLFLDLLAAESLVVFMSSLFPNFVISLALTAFANGLWMSVGGFLVSPTILNVFWKYVFHYIDYQAYVFQGMMVNEFAERTYDCGTGCQCMYPSELSAQCKIAGTGVLKAYGYKTGRDGKWAGILVAIIVVYRVLGWAMLMLRKK
ncbi:hypothetical protein PRK78_004487 [Emydomyces testavorans]|uniref:ABC transporter domain-containing protein n=1 Tax=Emydomyces testavorans TaxID=2070801 RepID=A0AAF0DHV7_9EURO|nr:hypothetical protein PRK78_004487 [Emydomyces testavorans]